MDWNTLPKAEGQGDYFKWKELENGKWHDMKLIKAKLAEESEVPWKADKPHVKLKIEWDGKEYIQFVAAVSQVARGLKDNNIQEGEEFRVQRQQAVIELPNGNYADGYNIAKDAMPDAPKDESEDVNIENMDF